MFICKFIEVKGIDLRRGLGQCLMLFLPLLTCVALTFCSKSLYLYLTEGHHVKAETYRRRMLQCAAFVAPASVYLFHIVAYGPVLFLGGCFTILGLLAPSFLADNRLQELVFAVLFGTGVSITFQATSMAISPIFRANIYGSVLLLGLCAAVMSITQQLFEQTSVMFSVHLITGALVLVPIMFIAPAIAAMIGARGSDKTADEQDDDDPLLNPKTAEQDGYSENESLLTVSVFLGQASKRDNEMDTENNVFIDLTLGQITWKLCALLWWSIGIHLSFLSCSREPSESTQMITLVCFLSLFTFGIKIFLSDRKSGSGSVYDSDNATGYFVLGLLGISGLILRFYPLSTDVHCFSLLFTIGFFHQLQPSCKPQKTCGDCGVKFNWICVELVLTFCAMAIGYQISNAIYYNMMALIIPSLIYSEISLFVVSAANVLLSLRYRIKKDENSTHSTGESESYGQACC